MKIFFSFFALLLFIPGIAHASAPDMSIADRDIYFTESTLISGQQTRIYAKVKNVGDTDISAYVYFYQGSTPIGPSQNVSTVAGGEDDEVWIDFTVPYGSFNIRAEIKGTDPQDINPSNDIAMTSLFYPIIDADGDGIEDENDNCVNEYNPNQVDTDGDGQGDACDSDDDNDSVSDDVENEIGTDPQRADTDSDGISDAEDYDPLDNSIQEEPAPEPELYEEPKHSFVESIRDVFTKNEVEEENEGTEISDIDSSAILHISPKASFVYRQMDWKTYEFKAIAPNTEDVSYIWDFGDDSTSADPMVEHRFLKPGDYLVSLTVLSEEGEAQTDIQEIEISFFHLANPWVIVILVAIVVIGGGLLTLLYWKPGKNITPQKEEAPKTAPKVEPKTKKKAKKK